MTCRNLLTAVSALALVLWFGNPSFAKDDNTHEGTVVSVAEHKLTMSGKDGKDEHTHEVGADAKVTLNGKEAKLADLKKGDKIKVTMGDDKKVTKVEARRS
ncbi:MAG TPA: hypothetical protein VHR66_23610 [Gemmataceae bacterium]|jgi:hypothetical protein|nr:hypothetical protein [Gemmataceae bacterium]